MNARRVVLGTVFLVILIASKHATVTPKQLTYGLVAFFGSLFVLGVLAEVVRGWLGKPSE